MLSKRVCVSKYPPCSRLFHNTDVLFVISVTKVKNCPGSGFSWKGLAKTLILCGSARRSLINYNVATGNGGGISVGYLRG